MTAIPKVRDLTEDSLDYLEAMTCFHHTNYGTDAFLNGLNLERVQFEALKFAYPESKIEYRRGSNQVGTDIVIDDERVSTKSGLEGAGCIRVSSSTTKGLSGWAARDYLASGHQDGIFFSSHSKTGRILDRSSWEYTWAVNYKIGYIDGPSMDEAILNADHKEVKSSGDTYFHNYGENMKIRIRENCSVDLWLDHSILGKVLRQFTAYQDPVSKIWKTTNPRIEFSSAMSVFSPSLHLKGVNQATA